MRWDELFADLEGQLEDGIGALQDDERIEEERLRVGRATLRDRFAAIAAVREPVRVRLLDGSVIAVTPRTVGRDWASGDLSGTSAQAVLPLAAIAGVLPTAAQVRRSLQPAAPRAVTDSLGLPVVLRDLARRRRVVQLLLRSGPVSGTLDRVGRDHLDLAVHAADEWRRDSAVSRLEIVPLGELLLLRVD